MADRKVVDESHKISDARGNGTLRREIWIDGQDRVTRYNLAYINHQIYQGDNQHGYHHRHHMGVVEACDFMSFEDIEERFEKDWLALAPRKRK